MNNPYLDEWKKLHYDVEPADTEAYLKQREARTRMIFEYSYAIPNDEAIQLIKKYSPDGLVEIGAGTGYWSSLIAKQGIPVTAYDLKLSKYKQMQWGKHYPVSRRTHKVLKRHSELVTLFLCWPSSPRESWVGDAVRYYRGGTIIYVGEPSGGASADNTFFDETEKSWIRIASCGIPQWWRIHDELVVYRRKE